MSETYSADTDDLDAFVERSGRDVAALGATVEGLEGGRARLALLPLPWFVQTSTLDRYRDLVAVVGENGRFVAEVSDALKRHGTHTGGVYRADASLIDQALAASDADRLDDLEQSLVAQGVDPDIVAAITAEVAAALRADPTLSFGAATRAGFAAHRGVTVEEAERAERAFTLSPPEAAAILDEYFDAIAGRHGTGDQITIEDLHGAIDDTSLPPEARDVAYRLAADATLFTNLDVAHQTDLSEEPLGNGFAWHEADGIIGRDDVTEFAVKDHQARILLAWHPLVETAGQGYDLTKVDSHASADDVVAFIEDEDIPVYVRLAVFDVYAQRHNLTVTEREVLEQELAFDGTTYGGGGTFLDAGRAPGQARTAPIAPVRTGPGGARGWSGGGAAVAAIAAQLIIVAGGFGWAQGRQARIARDGNPTIVHTDPLNGRETTVDPVELIGLSPAEAKAYVAHFAVHGTPPPEGADRIEPHAYLDPLGQWRMSDTNEPVWPGEVDEPLSPGQYVDLQGQRRWSDTNQLVEQFPNRSQYQDDDGTWRWADTGAAIDGVRPTSTRWTSAERADIVGSPQWRTFDRNLDQQFFDVLDAFGADPLPPAGLRGGEGQLFLSPEHPTRALKRWHESRIGDFDKSVDALVDARAAVQAHPVLASVLDVVEVHERGPDWIIRDYARKSVELRDAIDANPDAQRALADAIDALEGTTDPSLRNILRRLDRPGGPSANVHWSDATGRLLIIDMM